MIKLSSPATREFWEVPVLYEDEHLMVLDKPPGVPTAPESESPERSNLITLLHQGISEGKPWATSRSLSFLMHPVPLDAEVSGVLLLAKTKAVLVKLADLFGNEQPLLTFVALAQGAPAESRFSIEAKLAPHLTRAGLMSVNSSKGKRARTNFEVLERFARWTLLKCAPLTWRPHQLRVHLAYARLPIVGDGEYHGKALWLSSLKPGYHLKPKHVERPLVGRPCLHAEQLALNHPMTGTPLVVKAPWPKDLVVALKYLRKYAAV